LLFVGPLLVSGGVDVIDDSGRRTSVGTQLWDLSTLQASTDELAASLCATLLGPDDAQFTAEEAAADAMITSAWLANGSSGSAPALCPTSGAQR
jgi:hydroxyethylthiazole kinase-like sugar kinase family protein